MSYTEDVIRTVGIYTNIEDAFSQDAVLHRVFSSLLGAKGHVTLEIILTLYRLYFTHSWEPARTFFYLVTGTLLDKDTPRVKLSKRAIEYIFGSGEFSVPLLDPRTISGECDKHCDLLNVLWFDSESYYGDEGEGSESEESESESEGEGSEYSQGSVESVVTDEGLVDPEILKNLASAQWDKCCGGDPKACGKRCPDNK